jgi:hypothetical protein
MLGVHPDALEPSRRSACILSCLSHPITHTNTPRPFHPIIYPGTLQPSRYTTHLGALRLHPRFIYLAFCICHHFHIIHSALLKSAPSSYLALLSALRPPFAQHYLRQCPPFTRRYLRRCPFTRRFSHWYHDPAQRYLCRRSPFTRCCLHRCPYPARRYLRRCFLHQRPLHP